jgi:hypothetical protein
LRRFVTAFTVATAGTAALAAAADAATVAIAPAKACYLAGDLVTITGTGFSAGGVIDVAIDGESLGQRTAAADGTLSLPLSFGTMKAVKQHTLTMTDTGTTVAGSATYTGTTHQVATKNRQGRAGRKVKLRGYGFLNGPKAYMHVRGHGIRSNVFLARPKGPCGTFVVRRRFVPPTAASGQYKVQFDAKKRYSKKTRPRLVYPLTVFRTFG